MLRMAVRPSRGLTLIELMVALTLVAILAVLAAPSFSTWLQSTRIRGTAEAILTGLQTARSEATSRNVQVRFQLTNTLGSDCAWATDGQNWVIDIVDGAAADSPEGACDSAKSDTVAPSILFTRSASDGSATNVTVEASNATMTFNGLGRPVGFPAGGFEIRINGRDASECRENGGDLTCLRIQVAAAGQVRMCNPMYPVGDQQSCQE